MSRRIINPVTEAKLSVGPTFPTSPAPGHVHTRTDMEETFVWNGTYWFSLRGITVAAGDDVGLLAGDYLSLQGGLAGSATLGYQMLWDGVIVELLAWKGNTTDEVDFIATANGANLISVHLDAAQETGVAVNSYQQVSEGDIIAFKVSGDVPGGGGIVATFRRRGN